MFVEFTMISPQVFLLVTSGGKFFRCAFFNFSKIEVTGTHCLTYTLEEEEERKNEDIFCINPKFKDLQPRPLKTVSYVFMKEWRRNMSSMRCMSQI